MISDKPKDWFWKLRFGRLQVRFSWRNSDGWGRFGGGWQWCVGVRACSGSILFSLLVCELMFSWVKP